MLSERAKLAVNAQVHVLMAIAASSVALEVMREENDGVHDQRRVSFAKAVLAAPLTHGQNISVVAFADTTLIDAYALSPTAAETEESIENRVRAIWNALAGIGGTGDGRIPQPPTEET